METQNKNKMLAVMYLPLPNPVFLLIFKVSKRGDP